MSNIVINGLSDKAQAYLMLGAFAMASVGSALSAVTSNPYYAVVGLVLCGVSVGIKEALGVTPQTTSPIFTIPSTPVAPAPPVVITPTPTVPTTPTATPTVGKTWNPITQTWGK
jgi:hypothetical protein